MNRKSVIYYLLGILICLGTGFISSEVTNQAVNTWYKTIVKSPLTPPSITFPIAWTILYILMGIAWAKFNLIQDKTLGTSKRYGNIAFILQLAFNGLWSFIFFGYQMYLAAFIDIILLLASLIATMLFFYKISRFSSLILVPYLLWLIFASYLNLYVVIYN